MNVENIKIVRDHIAKLPPERFGMREWGLHIANGAEAIEKEHACGTPACIGGWAEFLLRKDACEALGLTGREEDRLFYMVGVDASMDSVKIPHAVAVLDRLIETGEVDWEWAMANPADLGASS